jgi:tRNA G18 (ribose-2'-O)-methylase SpoU
MNRKLKTSDLNRLNTYEFKAVEKFPVVVVLDSIRSLHNVGSAFRTADAFCIEKIVLCGVTARPPHREIHKTALGATESVVWEYFESAIEAVHELRKSGYTIISVEQAEKKVLLQNLESKNLEKMAFVFGNEVFGVHEDVIHESDFVLEIPQFGTKHSFNVSVTIGIVLWEALKPQIIQRTPNFDPRKTE